METPLERLLRLAYVNAFDRRSPRGREEHVRAHNTASRTAHDTASRTGKERWAANEAAATSAAAGSHEHAEELRSLAREAQANIGRNYLDLRDSHEGMPSAEVAADKAGDSKGPGAPESDSSRILHRAADMIDRQQPSMARVHAQSLREAAARESAGNPAMAAKMSAAAAKLEQLPRGKGLAVQPPATQDFKQRTSAARKYARGGKLRPDCKGSGLKERHVACLLRSCSGCPESSRLVSNLLPEMTCESWRESLAWC